MTARDALIQALEASYRADEEYREVVSVRSPDDFSRPVRDVVLARAVAGFRAAIAFKDAVAEMNARRVEAKTDI
jgi:hypothetical protein